MSGGERVHRRAVDDPARDVHVQALGFDVTALAPAELTRRGVVLSPYPPVTVGAGDGVWRSHSEVATDDPDLDHYDRSLARQSCHRHLIEAARGVPCPECRSPAGWPCVDGGKPLMVVGSVGGQHRGRAEAAREAGLATIEGLRLRRTFPCLGNFRHVEWQGAVRMVQCDRCGTELGVVRVAPEPEAEPKAKKKDEPPEPELALGEDDIPL